MLYHEENRVIGGGNVVEEGIMMMIRRVFLCVLALVLPAHAVAQEQPLAEKARLTAGVPLYVAHPNDRPGARDWNDGWLNNEGLLLDVSWPFYAFSRDTHARGGAIVGAFDNSIDRTSAFVGGMVEIETFATDRLAFMLGTYAGAVTGYDRDIVPGLTPYVGTSYSVTPQLELGVRGFWLPAETLAGSNIAPSDAYAGVATIGTRF